MQYGNFVQNLYPYFDLPSYIVDLSLKCRSYFFISFSLYLTLSAVCVLPILKRIPKVLFQFCLIVNLI